MKRLLKKKHEQKILNRVIGVRENRDFLLSHLKREWEAVERSIAKDKRKRKLYDIAKETGKALGFMILGMAAVCGVIAVGAVAPNIFSAFGRLGRHRRYFDKEYFKKRVGYLQYRGYIDVVEDEDDTMEIKLTELGEAQVVKRALGEMRILPAEKWDGIWRILIFDIPERNKAAREGFRECLKRMGFYRLQKSTFVFPYPCREEIEFLVRLYDVVSHVRFIETNSVSFDDDIKDFFSLGS